MSGGYYFFSEVKISPGRRVKIENHPQIAGGENKKVPGGWYDRKKPYGLYEIYCGPMCGPRSRAPRYVRTANLAL